MADNRKRNLIQLNLDKLAANSPYGRLFVEKYMASDVLAVRQALINNSLASGFMLEHTGLSSIFRALDSEMFVNSSSSERMGMLQRSMQVISPSAPPFQPPAATAVKAPLDINDLSRELLDDTGLLANTDTQTRQALIAKILAKYGSETVATPALEKSTSDEPVSRNDSQTSVKTPAIEIDESGATESVMSLPVKRAGRVKTFD